MTDNVIRLPGVPEIEAKPREPGLIEPAMAPEFFCGALARVCLHGPFVRLIWSVPEQPLELPEEVQNVVNVKVVLPTVALRAVYEALGEKLNEVAPSEDDEVSAVDPVFAAIERHNHLDKASNALLHREVAAREPGYAAWYAESSAATDAWVKARDEMFQTVPTTRAGAMALIGMLDRDDPTPEDMALLVRTLAEAIPSC